MKTAGYDPTAVYEKRGNTRIDTELTLLMACRYAKGPQPKYAGYNRAIGRRRPKRRCNVEFRREQRLSALAQNQKYLS